MKCILSMFGLAATAAQIVAGETLRLKVEPDHDYYLSGQAREVTVRIDLEAIADHQRLKRAPLNLALVLDHSGSMTGAKIEKARQAAMQLVAHVRKSVTIDWTIRESARAQIRVIVRRILRKYGYPPDKQEKATQTVLEQAELLCADWAETT